MMLLLSSVWKDEDVFFGLWLNIMGGVSLDCDLTLWEAFLLSYWSLSIFCYKLCELLTTLFASTVAQSLKQDLQVRVPITPDFCIPWTSNPINSYHT
jgi:hypothetical protein